MMGGTDLSFPAMLEQGADFLVMPMLGAMIYVAFAHTRRRGGTAPRVFGWSAMAGLVAAASRFLGSWAQEGLRAMPESHETPGGPLSFETWDLLHSLSTVISGLALLVAGGALVAMGWAERRSAANPGGRRRGGARASRSRR